MTDHNILRMQRLAYWFITAGAVCLLLVAAQVAYWAYDRRVPFELLSYEVAPTKRGDSAIVVSRIKRDTSRKCSVTYGRTFYDSKGVRFDLSDGGHVMNPLVRQTLNQRSPGYQKSSVDVPDDAAPGTATIATSLEYVCNPVHVFWPVHFLVEIHMEVLP